ncbi:MAG: hypothetical protein GY739_04535, partial [Mesoflavibacter sp.]|nr:hypothetical protein [Mesoflavibacter sp.]
MAAGAEAKDLVEEKKDEEDKERDEDAELLDYDEEGNPMRPPIGREDAGDSDDSLSDEDWCNYSVVDEVEDDESDQAERHLSVPELLVRRERNRRIDELREEKEASAGLDDDERDTEVAWRAEIQNEPMPTATARSGIGQWGSLKSYVKDAHLYNPYDAAAQAERRSDHRPDLGTGMAQESKEYTDRRRERSRLLNRRGRGSSSPSFDSDEVRRIKGTDGGRPRPSRRVPERAPLPEIMKKLAVSSPPGNPGKKEGNPHPAKSPSKRGRRRLSVAQGFDSRRRQEHEEEEHRRERDESERRHERRRREESSRRRSPSR